MSESRLTIFPKKISKIFPAEKDFIELLVLNSVVEPDAKNSAYYNLTRQYCEFLFAEEKKVYFDVRIWFECFEKPEIQVAANIQELEYVRTPDTKKEIGDLDFAYELIGELHEDMDAKWKDEESGKAYLIRELDFENQIAIGRSYFHIEAFIKPPAIFLANLAKILEMKISYAFYWL